MPNPHVEELKRVHLQRCVWLNVLKAVLSYWTFSVKDGKWEGIIMEYQCRFGGNQLQQFLAIFIWEK